LIYLGDDHAHSFTGGFAGGFQKVIWFAKLKIIKKDLIQLLVIVLAGMDDYLIHVPI